MPPGNRERRLFKQTGSRLSAITLIFVMRAIVEGINVCALGRQVSLQPLMECLDIGTAVKSERDAALIHHNDNAAARSIQ